MIRLSDLSNLGHLTVNISIERYSHLIAMLRVIIRKKTPLARSSIFFAHIETCLIIETFHQERYVRCSQCCLTLYCPALALACPTWTYANNPCLKPRVNGSSNIRVEACLHVDDKLDEEALAPRQPRMLARSAT